MPKNFQDKFQESEYKVVVRTAYTAFRGVKGLLGAFEEYMYNHPVGEADKEELKKLEEVEEFLSNFYNEWVS